MGIIHIRIVLGVVYLVTNKDKKHLAEEFRFSAEKVGKLYPILEDSNGNIIDGQHRLEADENWPKIRLDNVKTEKESIIIRLIGNVCRRIVPTKEKTEMLDQLGSILFQEGFKPGEIADNITEVTGMSYRWVVKYLPDKYKDSTQSNRRKGAVSDAHRATRFLAEVIDPPKTTQGLKISKYSNSDFVLFMLNRSFFSEFEKDCLELGVPPEDCVMKSLEEHHKKIRRAIKLEKNHHHTHKIRADVVMPHPILKPLTN